MVDVVEKSSIIEEAEKRARQATTGRVSVATAIAVLAVILTLPALLRPSSHGKLSFDNELLADLNKVSPDYVFIGNSMLHSRIDDKVIEAHLGERCCYLLWTGGAESAWAHQALKNFALATQHRPKKVFIFFRDTYLTQPSYRATDRYWWRIERLSHPDEPELDRAMRQSRTWQEELEFRLGEIYPVQKLRERMSGNVSWIASEVVTPGRVRYGEPAGQKYDSLFDLENLRSVEADDTVSDEVDLAEYNFDARVGTSLLPSMIHMAKDAGVGLVFIRVQRRPTKDGPPAQSPELQARRCRGALESS